MLWPQKNQLWTIKHDTIWWLRVWGSATPKPAVLSCWQSAGDLALARRLQAVGSVSNETLAWQGSKVGRNYIERYLFHEDIIPSPKAFEEKDRTYEKWPRALATRTSQNSRNCCFYCLDILDTYTSSSTLRTNCRQKIAVDASPRRLRRGRFSGLSWQCQDLIGSTDKNIWNSFRSCSTLSLQPHNHRELGASRFSKILCQQAQRKDPLEAPPLATFVPLAAPLPRLVGGAHSDSPDPATSLSFNIITSSRIQISQIWDPTNVMKNNGALSAALESS